MKPHELLQRQRRNRGKAAVPPQMRARNAQPAAVAAAAAVPARRPTFPGETREQELRRLRAAATVVRPGPAVVLPAGAPAEPPAEPEAPTYTLCSCPAHDGECGHVATLGAVWPMAAGVAAVDLCERCARAIKAGPVGQLVTGLQFVALQPPTHEDLPDDDGEMGDVLDPDRPADVQPVEGPVQP